MIYHLVSGLTAVLAFAVLTGVVAGFGGALAYPLDGPGHFRLQLGLVALALLSVALLLARWRAAWWALVAAVLAAAGLGPVWETPPSDGGEGRRVVVMTANLYQRNPDFAAAGAALIAAGPDILVTNETSKALEEGTDPLSAHYPYSLQLSTSGQVLRTVIWSRYPLGEGELMLEDLVEPTGARAVADLGEGATLTVLGLHLAHAVGGNQDQQVAALGPIADGLPRPLVVMGDFNATPWSHGMREIERQTGTARIPGYRVTWKGVYETPLGGLPAPMGQPIDHILTSPGIRVETVERVRIPGSDHLAVRAVLVVPAEQ